MRTFTKTLNLALICGILVPLVGCQTTGPADLIPAREVLNASCCEPDNESQINFLKLRQTPPEEYVLDGGDTLGVYIQGITGDKDIPPPVHFPEDGGQPALGTQFRFVTTVTSRYRGCSGSRHWSDGWRSRSEDCSSLHQRQEDSS